MFEEPSRRQTRPADVLIPPAVNISANASDWRGQALSNFCLSPFVLDGALYASIEASSRASSFPKTIRSERPRSRPAAGTPSAWATHAAMPCTGKARASPMARPNTIA